MFYWDLLLPPLARVGRHTSPAPPPGSPACKSNTNMALRATTSARTQITSCSLPASSADNICDHPFTFPLDLLSRLNTSKRYKIPVPNQDCLTRCCLSITRSTIQRHISLSFLTNCSSILLVL